jgi:site-specific DNA recombinase
MRTVIYARYSSDLQRDASIEDQVRLCRERIDREGWTYLHAYTDRAQSGASTLRRAYQQLLEDARARKFDVVVAEALDRLSRDQEDVAALYKRLTFAGVRLVTLAEGEISELHVGLKGTMNALFLKDLAAKTHRGMRGRIEQGRSGGGRCYGYSIVREVDGTGTPVRGARAVNPDEAAIVRRIFEAYANGRSPRQIARSLNEEGILGPAGCSWGASTIHGNWRRGTGLLNNELYSGRLVWNRQRFVKDPRTAKRIARLNPQRDWFVHEVPELRIIDQALWDAVKARQQALHLPSRRAAERNVLNDRHRPRYLLSGLLTCGVCGGGYTLVNPERYGCANRRNRGTCANSRLVLRGAIERRVLAGLKEKLLAPELVAEFIREFHAEWNRRMQEAAQSHDHHRRELGDVERKRGAVMAAIESGIVTATTKDRLLELEARRDQLKADLEAPPAPVLRIHPNLAELYRQKVAALEEALNRPEDRDQAHAALRGLVDQVLIHPGEKRGEVRAELYGELASILELMESKNKTLTSGDVRVSLVAGAGFEPTTFRL